jgi:predicted transcriptional regulator
MTHVYYPLVEEQTTKEHLLGRFVDTVYRGATDKIMMQLLGSKKASAEDIAAIQEILDKLNKK